MIRGEEGCLWLRNKGLEVGCDYEKNKKGEKVELVLTTIP